VANGAWDTRTWAIILIVGVFAIVFARAEQAYRGVHDVQEKACEVNNDRNRTAVRALIVLSHASSNRREAWSDIYDQLDEDDLTKLKPVAEVMIGSNAVESQSLRELADYIGDSALNPAHPNAKDPQVRSQSDC